jgi:hypothetical protein
MGDALATVLPEPFFGFRDLSRFLFGDRFVAKGSIE